MNNHANYIVSLGDVCRWLAKKAEALAEGALAGEAGKPQTGTGAALVRLAARSVTGGGSFLYHLKTIWSPSASWCTSTYKNPYLYPFEKYQRFKTHPAIRGTFEGGKRFSYGARAITEGGYQSVPKLFFPVGH
ncbi:hypothetical protein [Sinorhizobium meliloti]|uniref:hypothetical protein n=1 Tax=Rhizobium meliloti TaxID=382 RepID=UPI002D77235E|nr:hypothetical protein [Sinorhizobium meliloti]